MILCKDWAGLFSPTLLGITDNSSTNTIVGIFLDPPYSLPGREDNYRVDSLSVAHDVKAWAVANGDNPRIRIAVAGYKDDYDDWPEGWEAVVWSETQNRGGALDSKKEYDRTECLWFSPHCRSPEANQMVLPLA